MVSARNLLYKKPHALPLAPCCKNEREASRLGDDAVPQRQLNLCFRVMSRFQLFHARIWVKPSQFGHSSSYPSLDVVLIVLRTHQYSEHIQCAYLSSSSRVWHIYIIFVNSIIVQWFSMHMNTNTSQADKCLFQTKRVSLSDKCLSLPQFPIR